jgi:hypothetical protein
LVLVGLGVFVDREDGTSGREEVDDDDDLLAAIVALVEADLLSDGEILAKGALMGWLGLADVVLVVT